MKFQSMAQIGSGVLAGLHLLRLPGLCLLFTAASCATKQSALTPTAAGPQTLRAAAESAGFRVISIEMSNPPAVRPLYPFQPLKYDDTLLRELRTRYELEKVVAPGRDEWEKQCLLKHWIRQRIPNGTPTQPGESALEVLDNAAHGAKYWCSYYGLTYMQCAQALGWTSRKLGIDRLNDKNGLGSRHHGVAEIWSNQFGKWVVIDCQSDLHYEKNGIPLSAWEIRSEWLKNKGADVQRIVGAPDTRELKNPAICWWDLKQEDETAVYFWIYYADSARNWDEVLPNRFILPQDSANAGRTWYQGSSGRETPHWGYEKKLFLSTPDPAAFNWTVGVVEAKVTDARPQSVTLTLDSYSPNLIAYEANLDGAGWKKVEATPLSWPLHTGANSLRLRTLSAGAIAGPEFSAQMELAR